MAITFASSAEKTTTTTAYVTSVVTTPSAAIATGNLLVAVIGTTIPSTATVSPVTTITDTQGNTWTKATSTFNTTMQRAAEIWYATATANGTPTITITANAYVAWAIDLRVYSGTTTGGVLEMASSAVDGTYQQSHSVNSTGSSTTGDLVISAVVTSNGASSFTPASGYTAPSTVTGAPGLTTFAQHKLSASGGFQNATVTTSAYDQGLNILVAFKPAITGVPDAPLNVAAAPASATSTTVTWSPPAGAASYKIKRSTSSGGTYTQVGTSSVASFTDTGLTTGQQYWYEVLAVNTFGDSVASAPVAATPVASQASSWYDHGYQPTGKTLAAMQTVFKSKYNAAKSYMLTQDGMPAGMPAGAWRVKIPDQIIGGDSNPNGTVSEGIGYWMLLTAYASRQGSPIYDPQAAAIFDGLWTYYKYFRNNHGLMNWLVDYQGNVKGRGGATDGNMDAALGLVITSRHRPSTGAINYIADANALIAAIGQYEYTPSSHPSHPNLMTNGDQWGMDADRYMPDYFRPAHMTEFAVHSGNTARWNNIISANQSLATTYFYNNFATGYVPDGCTRTGASNGAEGYKYGYNSIRMPWNLALHFLWTGDTASGNMITKLANAERARASQVPANAKAEGTLDGTSFGTYINAAYMSGFTVAGVGSSSTAQWAADGFDWLAAHSEASYFGQSLELLALLILTGEFKQYRAGNPSTGGTGTGTGGTGSDTSAGTAVLKRWTGSVWQPVNGLTVYGTNLVAAPTTPTLALPGASTWAAPTGWTEVCRWEPQTHGLAELAIYGDYGSTGNAGYWKTSNVQINTVGGVPQLQLIASVNSGEARFEGGAFAWYGPSGAASTMGGRWEFDWSYDAGGNSHDGVALLWPDIDDDWPTNGEIDAFEFGGGSRTDVNANYHLSTTPGVNSALSTSLGSIDFSTRRACSVEWRAGAYIEVSVDGTNMAYTNDPQWVPSTRPMHLVFQQDWLGQDWSTSDHTGPVIMRIFRMRFLTPTT